MSCKLPKTIRRSSGGRAINEGTAVTLGTAAAKRGIEVGFSLV